MTDSFLLYKNKATDKEKGYYSKQDIIKDLGLDIIFRTMSRQDMLISRSVRKIMMIPLETSEQVLYRQEIINDFYKNPDILESMYECVVRQDKALVTFKEEMEKNHTRQTRKTSELLEKLKYLEQGQKDLLFIFRLLCDNREKLESEGLKSLLYRLGEEPLEEIQDKTRDMDFFVSGGETSYTFSFGGGFKISSATVNYCRSSKQDTKKQKQGSLHKLYLKYVKKNSVQLNNNAQLQEDINHLEEFTIQHILKLFQPYLSQMMSFYSHFIEEISFYMGVINIMKRMDELNITLTMPEPAPAGTKDTSFENLYELSMAVYVQKKPVGNSIILKDNILTLITGANQGGKSTFLRSYGIAQVMMQCGMPVPADKFCAPVYRQVFTHFTRREDERLNYGRLGEELGRMAGMVRAASPGCLFLLNESFASTTEKEGSHIAREILHAFYDKEISVIMVTHLFQLAKDLYNKKPAKTTFLVAERKEDGRRTFRMLPGKPEYTSYGMDLFKVLEEDL